MTVGWTIRFLQKLHTHSAQYSYIGLHTSIVRTYVTMRATNATLYYLWQRGPPRNSLTMTGPGVVSMRGSSHWAPETVNHTHSTGIAETA